MHRDCRQEGAAQFGRVFSNKTLDCAVTICRYLQFAVNTRRLLLQYHGGTSFQRVWSRECIVILCSCPKRALLRAGPSTCVMKMITAWRGGFSADPPCRRAKGVQDTSEPVTPVVPPVPAFPLLCTIMVGRTASWLNCPRVSRSATTVKSS